MLFDGRKDKTINQVLGEDKKFHRKTLLQEHLTIVTEPEANYFNLTNPKSGPSQDIPNSIVKTLKDRNVNTDNTHGSMVRRNECKHRTNGWIYSVNRRVAKSSSSMARSFTPHQ